MGRTQIKGTQVKDDSITGTDVLEESLIPSKIPFSNSFFSSTNIEAAIVEASSSEDLSYVFSRRGNSEPKSWLKIQGIPSNESGYSSGIVATKLIISATCEEIATGVIRLFVKKAGQTFFSSGYGAISFLNERTKTITIDPMGTTINIGDEISMQVISGNFENLVVHVRILK